MKERESLFTPAALLLLATFSPFPATADVRLPALFGDRMVLQQGQEVPVWGWAEDGERITVRFGAQTIATVAAGGRWQLRLAPLAASATPETLIVTGRNRIDIRDVLVGEVWIAAGQSNMGWPMSKSEDADADISNADDCGLRLFNVARRKAESPVDDVKGEWACSNPVSVNDFSAVAWYFGRALRAARKVPVGLIHTSAGSSPAEAWMSMASTTAVAAPPGWHAAELYNGMIAPLIPYAMKGALWYQGESNVGRAWQYRTLLPTLISGWRSAWHIGDFPFLLVQLAPWDRDRKRSLAQIAAAPVTSALAELREAQALSTKALPNVGMAVITDAGDQDALHPRRKRPVGERLALLARGMAYGEPVIYSGPAFKDIFIAQGEAVVRFDNAGTGLVAESQDQGATTPAGRDIELNGFAIAGADRKFFPASAIVRGETVVVSSPRVPGPVAIRFGWADYPVVNLYNSAGLPASPFRTDDWPVSTQPR